MAKLKVLLLGATGETGGDILHALLEDGNFEISLLTRPSSASKPEVQNFQAQGLKIVTADISGPIEVLTEAIRGHDILISAISAGFQLDQLPLVDAAARAGINRFLPCAFTIPCPPTGVMKIRDDKEIVYQRILFHKLPYTIVDVGYWHQLSWFSVPSGKFEYADLGLKKENEIFGDGEAKNLLGDKRDIGRWVVRIIQDPRTLNQKVFTHSDAISQIEIKDLIERKTGEKVDAVWVSESELRDRLAKAIAAYDADTSNTIARIQRSQNQYNVAKYIRKDNTVETAEYLGYQNARQLYPDFKPISFEEFLDELLAGKAKKVYANTYGKLLSSKNAETK